MPLAFLYLDDGFFSIMTHVNLVGEFACIIIEIFCQTASYYKHSLG